MRAPGRTAAPACRTASRAAVLQAKTGSPGAERHTYAGLARRLASACLPAESWRTSASSIASRGGP